MSHPVLRARAISRRFGKTQALDGVDLVLEDGAFTALLGPAGAGKTTTLRILAGLDAPDSGVVEIMGKDATALEPRQRNVAMIFDTLALYPEKTGFENIANPLRIARMPRDSITAKVRGVAETLQVTHILDRLPRTMSGGERQRIALGRALVRDPAFYLLDEPLSSLDAKLRIELRAELRRLQRERGASFLYATPDFTEAMAVADKIAVLIAGRIRQVAAPQELYERPVDRYVARFVGAPEINILAAEYDPSEGGVLRIGGLKAQTVAQQHMIFNGAASRFEAGLRPEHVVLAVEGADGANASVTDTEPLGLKVAVTVDTGQAQIRALVPEHLASMFAIGAAVTVSLKTEHILCFDAQDGHRLG